MKPRFKIARHAVGGFWYAFLIVDHGGVKVVECIAGGATMADAMRSAWERWRKGT